MDSFASGSEVFDKYILLVIFILFLIFSSYTRKEKVYIYLVFFISILVVREVITPIIRLLYYHPWPLHSNQIPLLFSENAWTFPSGHSAFLTAFAAIIFIGMLTAFFIFLF